MNPQITLAQLTDIEALCQIDGACQIHPWTNEQFAGALSSQQQLWVIKLKHQIAGFLLWQVLVNEAEIYHLAIKPVAQKQGLASLLLQQLFQSCQELKIHKIFLEVRASNLAAQNLYRKHQFKKIAQRQNYYRTATGFEHAWVMEHQC